MAESVNLSVGAELKIRRQVSVPSFFTTPSSPNSSEAEKSVCVSGLVSGGGGQAPT